MIIQSSKGSYYGVKNFVRKMTGALAIFSAVAMAWFYPLTRERHARIRRLLARRKERTTN